MSETFESRMERLIPSGNTNVRWRDAQTIAREMDAREAALLVKLREHEDAVVQRDAELFRLRQELSEAKAALAARGVEIADAVRILQSALDDEECANGNASGALDISTITAAKAFIARAALAPRVPAGEGKEKP